MASVPTVTIERSYFDTLLRCAPINHSTPSTSNDPNTITIFRTLHVQLLKQCEEYQTLRAALIAGGVTSATLNVLVAPARNLVDSSAGLWQNEDAEYNAAPIDLKHPLTEGSMRRIDSAAPIQFAAQPIVNKHHNQSVNLDNADQHELDDDLASIGDPFAELDNEGPWHALEKQHQRREQRNDHTLLFSSLPEEATHKDVTSLIKGGRLIQIWLRENERSAAVTFAEGAAAFLAYSRRNPLYIKGKRVEVSWSDYQFSPHKGMLNKLAMGMSRNMVIRNALNRVTTEEVTEHVDHVHQLKVVQSLWRDYDLYLSTNSITGASLARLCLLSRQKYKNLRIEWYPDECAAPLPQPAMMKPRSPQKLARGFHAHTSRQAMPPTPVNHNRFNILSLNDTSSDIEEDDSESTGSNIQLKPRSAASGTSD